MSREIPAQPRCTNCAHVLAVREDDRGRDVVTCARDECECVPVGWADVIRYALAHTGGVVKTSTVTRHSATHRDASEARAMLDRMTAEGYLTEPTKDGRVYVWHVTGKGREAVE